MTLPPEPQLLVGIVDRTGELFDSSLGAADHLGLAATVEELDHRSFGPDSPREDVMVLGPRELTRAGLRRAARYAARHPACVLIALGVPSGATEFGGPTQADLRASGIRVSARGAVTRGKVTNALRRAVDEQVTSGTDALEGALLLVTDDDVAEMADEVPAMVDAMARLDAFEVERRSKSRMSTRSTAWQPHPALLCRCGHHETVPCS